ncbi:MAG TPA: RluA family pseudouridine synthase [Vicinamibacterales bacterium]|jgi:23S rRNA pseudouridine1911/1915/1917 synthase
MDRWTVDPDAAGTRLDRFLAAQHRLASRSRAATALERGKVFVNDREVSLREAGSRLVEGDVVRVWMDRPGSAKRPVALGEKRDLPIVFEDDAIVVLNKPAGVLAVPLERRADARSVYDDLREHYRLRRQPPPFVVHRIDRDTSGLVLFARSSAAQQRLRGQFRRREPERVYLAVVYGHVTPEAGTWRDRMVWDQRALIQKETHPRDPEGKDAICQYRVVERFERASLVEISLVTGRRNQIRLQARLHGHMLVGEQRYTFGPESLRPIAFARQALHAHRLRFRHPFDDRPLGFEAPMPDDLVELVERLRH